MPVAGAAVNADSAAAQRASTPASPRPATDARGSRAPSGGSRVPTAPKSQTPAGASTRTRTEPGSRSARPSRAGTRAARAGGGRRTRASGRRVVWRPPTGASRRAREDVRVPAPSRASPSSSAPFSAKTPRLRGAPPRAARAASEPRGVPGRRRRTTIVPRGVVGIFERTFRRTFRRLLGKALRGVGDERVDVAPFPRRASGLCPREMFSTATFASPGESRPGNGVAAASGPLAGVARGGDEHRSVRRDHLALHEVRREALG